MTDTTKPVYMVVQLNVKNHDEYMQRYAMPVIGMFQKLGVEILAASPAPEVLEGQLQGNWNVILRFPSRSVAEQWYKSEEYQPLKSLRLGSLTDGGSLILMEAFDPAALGG